MIHISFFALLCATATGIVVANIIYNPLVFGFIWSKLLTNYVKNPEQAMMRSDKIYGLFYVYSFIVSLALGELIYYASFLFAMNKILLGLSVGFFLWAGIVTPIQFLDYEGEGKPLKLLLLNIFTQFCSLLTIGAVLGLLMPKNL